MRVCVRNITFVSEDSCFFFFNRRATFCFLYAFFNFFLTKCIMFITQRSQKVAFIPEVHGRVLKCLSLGVWCGLVCWGKGVGGWSDVGRHLLTYEASERENHMSSGIDHQKHRILLPKSSCYRIQPPDAWVVGSHYPHPLARAKGTSFV